MEDDDDLIILDGPPPVFQTRNAAHTTRPSSGAENSSGPDQSQNALRAVTIHRKRSAEQLKQQLEHRLPKRPKKYSVQFNLPLEASTQQEFGSHMHVLTTQQIIERIAILINNDADLRNFALTCKDFASALAWDRSTVWRCRFLEMYDYPHVPDQLCFPSRYRVREMILRKFPLLSGLFNKRGRFALDILKDMVLESYHHPSWKAQPSTSRNLEFLSEPITAPFMYEFLGAPFFAYKKGIYGMSNRLFAILQLQFSYMVLNPDSIWSRFIHPSRSTYDLACVYLVDKVLELFFREVRRKTKGKTDRIWELDVESLLHIKNFWHAHFATSADSKYSDRPLTYSRMVRSLNKRGHSFKAWEGPLSQTPKFGQNWFGHYSCAHMAGRRLDLIEDHQTCAVDWINTYGENGVHPLNLDLETTKRPTRGWWPAVFAQMPILSRCIPMGTNFHDIQYIRGIAPFVSPPKNPALYSRFRGLRVRGFLHPVITDQEGIPGYQRIVLVLFQPTARYLLTVLEHNAPPAENPFAQMDVDAGPPVQAQPIVPLLAPADLEEIFEAELEDRDELKGPLGPALLTRSFIRQMEDNLHPPEALTWEMVKWAYCYEGVVIPGGKIMMGRYWRFGPPLVGNTWELGDGADRGPWIFWC